MLQNLSGWHALVILTIVLLIFGSAKLPALAKSVGESMRILKQEVHEDQPTQRATEQPAKVATASVDATADRLAS